MIFCLHSSPDSYSFSRWIIFDFRFTQWTILYDGWVNMVMTRKLYLQIARSDLNVLRAAIVDFIFYLDIKLWFWFCCFLFLSFVACVYVCMCASGWFFFVSTATFSADPPLWWRWWFQVIWIMNVSRQQ